MLKQHSNDHSFYNIIRKKIPQYAEIVVNLFDHCNMRCVFCPQDHEDIVGMSRSEILSKVPIIKDFMINNPSIEFQIHVMGGELFQDDLIKSGYLEIYTDLINEIKQACPVGKTVVFNFISNLVFTQTEKVISFLQRNKIDLAISYDPVGRFNQSQRNIFEENVDIFLKHIRIVSCTMTKNSIEKIIQGDAYFDYLYNRFTCDWDYLLPGNDKLKAMMPSESDLQRFFIHLVDHYPRCSNVIHFTKHDELVTTPCTRGNNITIFSDNSIPPGCSGSVILKDKIYEKPEDDSVVKKFIGDRDCLQCEFYSRCTFSCFVSHDYQELVRDVDGCLYKEVFKYVSNKSK